MRYPRASRRYGAQSRGLDRDPRARRRSPRGFEGGANGPHAGLLRVLCFLPDWKEAVGLCRPSCLTWVCVFQSDLSAPIRVSLIVVSDNIIFETKETLQIMKAIHDISTNILYVKQKKHYKS